MARSWGVLPLIAILATALTDVSTARAGDAPMPGMAMGSDEAQDPEMRAMTAAPLPFGIMIGRAERWMIGYEYMYESLDGLLDGTDSVNEASVLSQFATTPTDMTMQKHMGMVMYAPTKRITVMAMLPYISMSMGELHRDGTRSTERSEGIGDVELRGLYSVYSEKDLRHRVLVNFGVGLPTGSIDQRDAEGARMEYPMQIGSGTYSLLPGFTYLGRALPWSWGAALDATVRLGSNANGYRVGDRYESRAWVTRHMASWVCLSAGARSEYWGNIHGSDPTLDPTDEPTKDPNLQGGKRLDVSLGATFHPPGAFFKGQQFLVDGEIPLLQSLDGPQLARSYMAHVAWQWEF
jgi:hypothetical protein